MSAVLLSASFPSGERGEAVRPHRPADIASAAAAVAEGVLRAGARIVFGGHPTISPIVLQVASILGAGPQVTIFQSEHFAESLTSEVHRLVEAEGAALRITPGGRSVGASLAVMRREMLAEDLRAAFFVGGMEGIRDEHDLLAEVHPDAVRYLLVAPGGMTARMADERLNKLVQVPGPPAVALRGRGYAALVRHALREVGF